jgi:hypothetical protein
MRTYGIAAAWFHALLMSVLFLGEWTQEACQLVRRLYAPEEPVRALPVENMQMIPTPLRESSSDSCNLFSSLVALRIFLASLFKKLNVWFISYFCLNLGAGTVIFTSLPTMGHTVA